MIGTGANKIVINDARLLHNLIHASEKIKGITGKCMCIAGTGKIMLPLKSENGTINVVKDLDATFVPSFPYNLIPPQILIRQMRMQGFAIDYFKQNNKKYIFQ